jgi:hypothetical protein
VNKGILVVQTEAVAGRDAEFNDWYETVHIPEVLEESGFKSARRFEVVRHDKNGAPVGDGDWWTYMAVYEVEADDLAEALARARSRTLTPSDAVRGDLPDRVQLYAQISEHPERTV